MENLILLAQEDLIQRYNPHTIILYGSRARNDATDTSDIDIACFCDDSEEVKDARLFNGVYLDAWVYPTSAMNTVSDDALRFGDGVVLLDKFGHGEHYLS